MYDFGQPFTFVIVLVVVGPSAANLKKARTPPYQASLAFKDLAIFMPPLKSASVQLVTPRSS
jgi:hypothetical protein